MSIRQVSGCGLQKDAPYRSVQQLKANVAPSVATAWTPVDAILLQATPATWRMLIEAGWQGNKRCRALCGGEAVSRSLADAILERVSELWNMYGPTETTIWSTVEQVERGSAPINIGRPIANTQVYILDAAGEIAPIGVTRDLHRRAGVAIGYHQRPD